ncbi:aminotransferase class IV family protein [Nocardiopsis sp. LOL_012]|uniref:aminotransferase class IV family protein n=1 Tax=Nocardiopsis sp. LOL_012 TaxID=3345409 RepID=UPI003A859D3F
MELNGRPVGAGELAGLALYGYGHFTTMLVTDLRVRGLDLHTARLAEDCRALFGTDLDLVRVRELVRRAARSGPSPRVVRVSVFDPDLDLARPAARALPQILVTTRPAPDPEAPPRPLRLGTRLFTRDTPQVKSTSLFSTIRQRRAAQLDGHDDALFTGPDGRICEGPTWNIGFLDGRGIVWPQGPSLNGVTARLVDRAARDLGVPVATRPVTTAAGLRLAGAFTTNAATGVRPVTTIDGVRLPCPPLIARLSEAYRALPGQPL